MQTYQKVHDDLLDLETQYFAQARSLYPAPNACVTGGIQFAVIDTLYKDDPKPKPVVCVVGINYTQRPTQAPAFFPYLGGVAGPPRVADATTSCKAVAELIAAYNRNTPYWTAKSAVGIYYSGASGPFGSPAATTKSKLLSCKRGRTTTT